MKLRKCSLKREHQNKALSNKKSSQSILRRNAVDTFKEKKAGVTGAKRGT